MNSAKKQIVVIHGGNTFESYDQYLDFLRTYEIDFERLTNDTDDWKRGLRKKSGDDYEVILPKMPNSTNAQYDEWKIWFEKLIPHLRDGVMLVGHSLGGAFLVKYLSENKFPKKINGVFLVAAVYDTDSDGYPLCSFSLPKKIHMQLNLQTENIFLYHSTDDPVVPFSALEKFKKNLPNAKVRVFENKGHFNQENFPEIVADIVNITSQAGRQA